MQQITSVTKMIFNSKSILVFIVYFTCCIWAWPLAAVGPSTVQRRSAGSNYNRISPNYNTGYESLVPADYEIPQENYNNPWDKAQEPQSYYDLLDDYWMNQPAALSELEAMTNFVDGYEPPIWGQIINQKPETELEELKAEERRLEAEEAALQNSHKYHTYEGRQEKRAQDSNTHPATPAITVAPTHKPVTDSPSTAAKIAPTVSAVKVKVQSGQKEIPLLRPPVKSRQNLKMDLDEPQEPVITVAARSSDSEKPSAYDTLRKYLSLEDALKKEDNVNNIYEREFDPISNINYDEEETSNQFTRAEKREFLKKEIRHRHPLSQLHTQLLNY